METDEQFQLFFDRHHRELGRLAYLLTDDAEAADGLAAAAFVAAWERWEHVRTSGTPTEYLWTLLVRRATTDDRDAGTRGLRDRVERPESRTVRDALALLSVRKRACLALRYAFGLPEEKIAGMVGISADAVRSELSKAGPQLERAMGIRPDLAAVRFNDAAALEDPDRAERLRVLLSEAAGRYEPSQTRMRMRVRVRARRTLDSEPRRRWSTPLTTSVASVAAVTAVIVAVVAFVNEGTEPPARQGLPATALPSEPQPSLVFTAETSVSASPSPSHPSVSESALIEALEASTPHPLRSRGTSPPPSGSSPSGSGKSPSPSASPSRIRSSRSSTPAPSPTRNSTRRRTSAPAPTPSRADTAPAGVALGPGSVVSLESVNVPGYLVRHRSFRGRLDPINASSSNLDRADATFAVRQGLANPSCVSFESSNFPGYYLRHRNFEIFLHRRDNSGLFAADATFCGTGGLAGQGTSLRSHNYPTHYLRHRGGLLYLNSFQDAPGFRMDATFAVRPGL